MTDPLLTIGTFARAVGLTPSALRHYDECGLLPPAEVDDATGYRYYTPDLARRARLVAQMRDAGLSIETMRSVLGSSDGTARAVLQRILEDETARSARTSQLLAGVLHDLEAAENSPRTADVGVRGPELAAALRQVQPAADNDASSPLSTILVEVADGSVDVVATNRYWMAVRSLPIRNPTGEARAVLGRAGALAMARRLDRLGDAAVEVSERGVAVAGEQVASRPGPYPAHRVLIAGLEPVGTRAVLSHDELVQGVEAAGRAEVIVTLSGAGAAVRGGDGPAHGVAGSVVGPEVTLRLGSALTLRALGSTLGSEVEWAVSAPDRPIRVTSPYQPGFLALLMPLGGT